MEPRRLGRSTEAPHPLERLAPSEHPELHPVVGKVKDMLAGMVVVISFAAAVVAMLALYATVAA